jgi:hypothetical protein
VGFSHACVAPEKTWHLEGGVLHGRPAILDDHRFPAEPLQVGQRLSEDRDLVEVGQLWVRQLGLHLRKGRIAARIVGPGPRCAIRDPQGPRPRAQATTPGLASAAVAWATQVRARLSALGRRAGDASDRPELARPFIRVPQVPCASAIALPMGASVSVSRAAVCGGAARFFFQWAAVRLSVLGALGAFALRTWKSGTTWTDPPRAPACRSARSRSPIGFRGYSCTPAPPRLRRKTTRA